jgi:hypothetical protein
MTRGKKIILSTLLLVSSLTSDDNSKLSTLTTLSLKSSKVLPNFQGDKLSNNNPFKQVIPFEETILIRRSYIEDKSFKIRQIDDNSFEVLGSPLEWGDVK